MKKKTIYSILIASLLFIVSCVTVYAAFIMTHNYEADIEYHEIKNATLSSVTEDAKVSFTTPGDKINVTYSLKNSDQREYVYYYSFEWGTTSYNDSIYLDMIYVYQDGEYIGILKDYLYEGVNPKKNLPLNEYIFQNETIDTVFTFELHNEASTFESNGISISFKVMAHLSTTNVQEVLFADSTTFGNVMVDVNSSGNQTIVLKSDVTSTISEITKDCTIDLCGNTLTLSNAVSIGEGVNVKVIDSRSGGEVAGEGFNLGHATSFVELEAPVSKITASNYNKDKLIEILENNYSSNNVVYANEEYDLFGYYSVYGLTASSSDVTISNGVIQPKTSNSNTVITVTVEGVTYEFKYIANDSSVISDILDNHLKHLVQFESSTNGLQVQHDLFLPTAIKEYNATISWHSSNTHILSNDGIIQEDQGNVLLTATIKVHDIVFIQEYYVYIVKPDNLSKLQYLISKVEQGVTLNDDTDDTSDDIILDVILTNVGQQKYLPVAGEKSLEHHYTVWTDGLDLDILDIEYSLEGVYQYLTLNQTMTGDVVTDATVSLNQITYSKAARVLITATFDNGEVLTSYVTVTIHLGESSLADQVYEDIQNKLSEVDVLQNILDTRKELGTLNECGDFNIPAKVDVVNVQYTSLNTDLYEIDVVYVKDEQGNDTTEIEKYRVHFKDLKYLGLTEKSIPIQCQIVVKTVDEEGNESNTEINPKILYFIVPAAITSENFVSSKIINNQVEDIKILDMTNANIKRLFYSIKLQTLQQASCLYYDKSNEVLLTDVSNPQDIYDLGEYILINDIENVSKLMFEYGRTETILDYYDLDILSKIIEWATYAPLAGDEVVTTTVENTPSIVNHIDSNLFWISNDGEALLSDGEIAVILSYAEKYPGFKEIWEQVINTLDNNLTDDEVGEMLEALAQDKTYTSILKWILDDVNSGIPLNQWLLLIDEESEYYSEGYTEVTDEAVSTIVSEKNIPSTLLEIKNGNLANVTDDEERLMIYYVLANHPEKYNTFINKWYEYVNRLSNDSSTLNSITLHTTDTNNTVNAGSPRNPDDCYDPVFTAILNWAFYVGPENVGVDTYTLGKADQSKDYITVFNEIFDDELSYGRGWYRTTGWTSGTNEGELLILNEWKVISKYLNLNGINQINYGGESFVVSPDANVTNNVIVEYLTEYCINEKDCETVEGVDITCKALKAISLSSSGFLGSSKFVSLTLADEFLNAIIDAVNEKYQNVSSYNLLVDWAKDTTYEIETWRTSINNQDVDISANEVENIRIKDGTSRVSHDEYYVLYNCLNSFVISDSIDTDLRNIIINCYLNNIDMTFQPQSLSSNYTSILATINDVEGFDETVEEITTLGSRQSLGHYYCRSCKSFYSDGQLVEGACPTENCDSMIISAYFDNLSTISADEIKQLILIKPENEDYIDAIKAAFNAYSIEVEKDGENYTITVTPVTTGDYDRDLSTDDTSSLKAQLNENMESNDSKYTHISLDQISDTEVDSFGMLTHFTALKEISFRGTSATYLFESNSSANGTFGVVALGCETVEKLTMNYCGLSDVTPVSGLLNLKYLNLKNNYSKEGYVGLANISELIHLNDLKNVNSNLEVTYPKIEYVNVYNTDISTERAQIVLGKLYEENNSAELWLDVFGEETKYPFEQYLTDNQLAIYALSLLYELDTLTGDYIVLPDKVYRQDGESVDGEGNAIAKSHDLTWKVVIANSLVKISTVNSYKLLERLSNSGGQVTICASVTVNDVTETRYFVIDVIEITE